MGRHFLQQIQPQAGIADNQSGKPDERIPPLTAPWSGARAMIPRSDPDIVKRLNLLAAAAAIFSMMVGLSVLAGWILNIAALLTWGAGTPMAPNAAACFVLAGFSLWLLREEEKRPSKSSGKLAARAAAAMVSLAGLLALIEHLFRRDFRIDRLFLLRPPGLQIASFRILMSPVTAGAFLLFGLALQGINWRTKGRYWVAQFFCLPAFIAPAFALFGLLWGPSVSAITVPLPTGVAFLALTAGLLCSRADWAIGGLLTRQSPGTTFLRRALPSGMLLVGIIGWLISKPLLTEVHFTWVEVSALAIVTGALLAGFISWIAIVVDRNDDQRKQLEEVLKLGQVQMDELLEQVEGPETEARLRRWAKAAFTVAVLLTVLLSVLSWRGAQQTAENADWVAHTHEVMTVLESALRHSLDVETGGRGFAETGSPPFLEPYETGRRAVVQDLHALRPLLVNADQLQRLNVLDEQTKKQVEDVEAIVATRQNTGKIPTVALFEQGKHVMDAVRMTVEEMEVAERGLLALRTQRAHAAQHSSDVVIALGSLLGVIFLSVAAMTVNREIGVSARGRAQIKALNAGLERRVGQRTAALQAEVAVRKRIEETRERLAAIVDSSDDAIITKTLEGIITAWNRGAERIFGYTASEAVGRPMLMLLPPERIAEETDILARIGQGRNVEHFETVRVCKDGTRIDVSVTISPIRDGDGTIVGASKIARTITERKRAEDALRDSEERLRLALEGGRLGTWQWKIETDELDGSPLSFALFGLPADTKFNFAGFRATLHPQDRILVDESMRRCLAGEAEYDVEYRAIWPDGTERWVAARGQAYKDAGNEITHVRGVVSDITDRRQAQVALRESQERFQVMANGIQQLAWMAEADGSIFWYNQRWYDYTGTTPGQTEGWTWEKIHDPAVLPAVLDGWKRAIADGTPFDMEFPLRGADGSFRMFLTRVMPVRNAEGRVVRWLGTNTDISERKKAEEDLGRLASELAQQAEDLAHSREDLEQQSSMLKLILESMGEGLIAVDAEGHFLLWNDAANKLMGREAADLPPEEWTPHYKVFLADAITPCPVDRLPLVRALGGESVHEELMIRPPEPGAEKFIEVTARPLKDARGTRRGGVAVLHDITERKRDEAELTRQAEDLAHSREDLEAQKIMLQSVLNSMVEGLVAADAQGKFILWNPAAEKIIGLGAADLSPGEWGAHYGTYLPDMVTPFPTEQTSMHLAIQGVASSAELFIRHPGLSQGAWIESNGAPLRDKDGVVVGGVVAFRDITRRREDELEIRKLNEELEERIAKRTAQLETVNHELEAFSYSVSHDLRAPLRHIGGFARILMSDFGSGMAPEAKDLLQRIHDAVIHMGMLVDGLLSLAKLGRQSLKVRPTDLNVIVAEAISVLQPECEGREIEWRVAHLPALECDGVLMGQVFQNLLGNAVKYSRGRTKAVIEVGSIQQAGKAAVVFVRDNGAGFDMQYAEKLFGVFQRMHTEEEFEGTGVGLATVQRIIQKHGGSVWAEAETDHGATFYFTLEGNGETRTAPRLTATAQ
jgi:PAS domain S-box-containing protein